jgi:copper chaperone
MEKATIKIKGMSCMGCVKSVKAALEAIVGVKSADVNLEEGTAIVEFDNDANIEMLEKAIDEAGFEVLT